MIEIPDIRQTLQKQAWANFILTLLLALVITVYFSYQIDNLRDKANTAIVQLSERLNDVNYNSLVKISELQSRNRALERELRDQYDYFDEVTTAMRKEYSSNNQLMLNLIKEIEEQQNIELSQLKEEVKGINVKSGDFSAIVNDVINSVVNISTNKGLGSGVIIASDGYVVTNNHVIEGTTLIRVRAYDGRSKKARLVNKSEGNDIALLKIDGDYSPLGFEDSLNVKVGSRVIAVGNPSGLDFTVTEGIISAIDRRVSQFSNPMIQTDVPINPGNSGGPLVNIKSKIVGINTFKVTGAESLGFAIPADVVRGTVMPWVEQDREAEKAKEV